VTVATDSYHNLAIHNRTMNGRLYAVVMAMDPAAVHAVRGGFFGSIFGGLNHIVFGDYFILTRVKRVYGTASSLDDVADQWNFEPTKQYGNDLASLAKERSRVDEALVRFARALTEPDLAKRTNLPNGVATLWVLLDHLFQHQTHHRGQITTLLTQLGVSYGSVENPLEVYLNEQSAA
jgi:uncharacterized damage-inducible protein DinB